MLNAGLYDNCYQSYVQVQASNPKKLALLFVVGLAQVLPSFSNA